jgi:hypothetical protein
MTDAHSDPPEGKRVFFRHYTTGDKAYLVTREGKQHIKYDRPYDQSTMLFRKEEWVPDEHPEPFSIGQTIQVAYATDRALCGMLGMHVEAKKQWASLSERERANFMLNGPKEPAIRAQVYKALKKMLEPFTRSE